MSKVTVEMPVDGCGLRRRREDGDRGQETEEAQQEQRKVPHDMLDMLGLERESLSTTKGMHGFKTKSTTAPKICLGSKGNP